MPAETRLFPCLKDNYGVLLHDPESGATAAIDAPEAAAVETALRTTGWRLTDDRFHDIGTSTTDLGRGRVVTDDEQAQYAFKTPTLRSVGLRGPYMNNASLASLDDVVRFYEKGGIARESRSPMLMPFGLTDQERGDLVAFMEALTGDDAKQGK